MGLLFSRFRRKQTTNEILDDIDKEINRLRRNRKVNQDRQKQFVTRLLIYSITAYVIAAIVFFCVCFPDTWQLRLIYSLPLLIFPVLVWGLKKSLHWYFVHRISSNDTALDDLMDRKNQILEDVMETETYKKAREILEKYDPEKLRNMEGIPEAVPPDIGTPGTVMQQRTFWKAEQTPMRMPGQQSPRPGPSSVMQRQNGSPYPSPPVSHQGMSVSPSMAVPPAQAGTGGGYSMPLRPPMPRSILPRERGTMDRLMDYLVGDGPENRYALICWQCFSHNGMALKEEFEYLSFRCCYCYTVNPARKQRPTAPRLEFFAAPGQERTRASDSTASSGGSNCSDVDKEDMRIGGSDRNTSYSDTARSTCISPIKPLEHVPIATPFSSSPLPDHNMAATASTIEKSRDYLIETKSNKLEFEVPKLHELDGEKLKSHGPDGIEPKSHEPDGIEPKSHEPDGIEPKSHGPDGIEPKSHGPDGIEPKSHGPDGIEPKSHKSIFKGPKLQKPINEGPKLQKPINEGPKLQKPINEGPKLQKPINEGPKLQKPINEGPKLQKPINEGPKSHKPLYEGPKSHEPDGEGPHSGDTENKIVITEKTELTNEHPVAEEPPVNEVSTLVEHQVTQELEDPFHIHPNMELPQEEPHLPDIAQRQHLTESSEDLRNKLDV